MTKIEAEYLGGENLNLSQIFMMGRNLPLDERIAQFRSIYQAFNAHNCNFYRRKIVSPAGPVVTVEEQPGQFKEMLMFGSNNYLDLGNHPFILQRTREAIDKYGVGIGGPPLLNGHTVLHEELETQLAILKHAESAMIFSSGYNANVGLVTALISSKNDLVAFDRYSHASFMDGLGMIKANLKRFNHNDMYGLGQILQDVQDSPDVRNKFIAVEGVYSMDGDLAPLPEVVQHAKNHGAKIILDDAHGTLVLGSNGGGTAEHFGLAQDIDITMGTFSKAFAVNGGFVAASEEIIDFMKFFARSYMFSASIPIPVVAAVLAGIELTRKDQSLMLNLQDRVRYATEILRPYGLVTEPQAAIITLRVPTGMNIRKASSIFHDLGIFINSIEYPAVPLKEQRFRVSMMATHTRLQIDQLRAAVEQVWNTTSVYDNFDQEVDSVLMNHMN
jgi:glycine C-acetyltransferase